MPLLTERQTDEVRVWLADHVSETCPACDLLNWPTVQPRFLALLDTDTMRRLHIDGPAVVAVCCRGCGLYLLFNPALIWPESGGSDLR